MKYIKAILSAIWQLPQDVLGYILFTIYTLSSHQWDTTWAEDGVILYADKMKGGISLGHFVILPWKYRVLANSVTYVANTLLHEAVGHRKQSLYLGWLYLIVIGLPSLVWAGLHRLKKFRSIDYYSFYTEKWADKLANIQR